MSDQTPRLQLNTFEPGDESWDHTDTVEAIDKHAVAHGSIDERPVAGEYDDELFHAVDQGLTWRWDATEEDWLYFAGKGTADRPVPGTSHFEEALATHVRSLQTPVWNVEAHGIEGDGTEVGQAVHELLDEVDEAGGGIVYFPPGHYLFERTPLIGDDTMLIGAGSSTLFRGDRTNAPDGRALISNKGYDQPGYSGASNWGVRDIRIDSPETNGIMPAHAENVRLENIYGERIYYHHIDIVSSKNVLVDGYWATRGGEGDSDAPMQFDNQTRGTTSNRVLTGEGDEAVADDDTPTKNCTLKNFEIDAENDPGIGVHIHRHGSHSLTIKDGYIRGCSDAAIRADREKRIGDLAIQDVSCIENARGIVFRKKEANRKHLKISDVVVRTEDGTLAGGSGLHAAGFESAIVSNVTVDGAFENSLVFDDLPDLKLNCVTTTGAENQGFRLRGSVDATLSNIRVADCSTGLYVHANSTAAYGGFSSRGVDDEVTADGELRDW